MARPTKANQQLIEQKVVHYLMEGLTIKEVAFHSKVALKTVYRRIAERKYTEIWVTPAERAFLLESRKLNPTAHETNA
jgi:transposase